MKAYKIKFVCLLIFVLQGCGTEVGNPDDEPVKQNGKGSSYENPDVQPGPSETPLPESNPVNEPKEGGEGDKNENEDAERTYLYEFE